MRLHILVEGSADGAFLKVWLPRFLPQHAFKIIPHQGKGRLSENPKAKPDPVRRGLLDQLPAKLRACGRSLNPATDRVLVLVDADEEPCEQPKKRLLRLLKRCAPRLVVLVRIAVEETEAFYCVIRQEPLAGRSEHRDKKTTLQERTDVPSMCWGGT